MRTPSTRTCAAPTSGCWHTPASPAFALFRPSPARSWSDGVTRSGLASARPPPPELRPRRRRAPEAGVGRRGANLLSEGVFLPSGAKVRLSAESAQRARRRLVAKTRGAALARGDAILGHMKVLTAPGV